MSAQPAVDARAPLDKVMALVHERVSPADRPRVERFARQYYSGVADEDISSRGVADLYGAVLAHWNFVKLRQPGTPKVHVYNPRVEEHGWQSTHTIVEVVTDDMPFLIDSLSMAVNRLGLTNHLVIHPVIRLCRDADGQVTQVLEGDAPAEGALTESVIHLEVDRHADETAFANTRAAILKALRDVRAAVEDWSTMRDRLRALKVLVDRKELPLPVEELEEAGAFLAWLEDNHFTFLGYREYELTEVDGSEELKLKPGTGLGILRETGGETISRSFSSLPPDVRALARAPRVLIVTKANSRSTVHRPGYLDYVGVKSFDENGRVTGEHRFLGLYTSAAYNRTPRDIPLLREKVGRVIEQAGYPPNSHAAKALINILETFPRDLLFQLDETELSQTAIGILQLQERQRVRLFVHRDPFHRFLACLVYVPRDRFNTQIRRVIGDILAERFGATDVEFDVQLSESVLARLQFVFRVPPGRLPEFDVAELERELREATRAWSDHLMEALLERCGEERGTALMRRYGEAFRADYREQYSARMAVVDIEHMETLAEDRDDLAMSLYRPLEAPGEELRFKLFRCGRPLSLSQALPMLENMGLVVEDEHPSKVKRADGVRLWVHDFGMRHSEAADLDLERVREKFHEAFDRVWHDEAENDGFNRLVMRAALSWRDIVVLRAYCKYLKQTTMTFSQTYVERALTANPDIAALLVRLFHARFDPDLTTERDAVCQAIAAEVLAALDGVANLDEDRILRSYLGLIQATLRTNFYQGRDDGEPKSHLSFKLDPERIPELPEPRPMYEVFVYSPQVEGVHLRGGPVARGGLRWSDRPEDFRTEVLGLVKAQMVKNAVIVPVGSKGGFFAKQLPPPGDRDAYLEAGKAAYRTFIRGLLDVTDNLVGGEVVPPPRVVRHDGDDPYLVVAADKGTATFSDIANGIAREYGYWLDDAFASGGSQGYDHKGMGITAKGAWESVKRSFRELDFDTQTTDFTAVGVGDMSGDVFGNGMLLSEHIRLVAAFNHLHVFIDPDPDAAASFAERKRLFELPRSTWDDYDKSLLSAGGGVYSRRAKSITLSPEARRALGVDAEVLTPNEVVSAILKAPVDLLWNGGIGTYVKSSVEHHDEVGDRANDAVRVNASELRCRVVGEGGNLGFTQLGRIEYAQAGGRIYTDAIDNSAGVDCSDHEVNIKVLLNDVVTGGDMTEKQRNALLVDMTDDVSELVLRDNYLQTQALSVASWQAGSLLEVHARLIKELERSGGLDRAIEFLPDAEEIAARAQAGRGLTQPELSVLLAYVKINLFHTLMGTSFAEDPFLGTELSRYFPPALRSGFPEQIAGHRLSSEIIATVAANEVVNRAGITGVFRLEGETGAEVVDIVRAYLMAREIFGVQGVWADIEALDNRVPASTQTRMLLEARKLIERGTRWLLRHPRSAGIGEVIAHYQSGVERLAKSMQELVGATERRQIEKTTRELERAGAPSTLARRVACFEDLYSALDLVEVATEVARPVEEVARIYFQLGDELDFLWFRDQIGGLPRDNRWQTLARAALRDDLYAQQSALTASVIVEGGAGDDPKDRIARWKGGREQVVTRCRQVVADLKALGSPDFAMLSVAMREIRALQTPSTGGVRSTGARAAAPAGRAAGAGSRRTKTPARPRAKRARAAKT